MLEEGSKIEALFRQIQQGDKLAFDALFNAYYPRLLLFACTYLKQSQVAEELTSELFVKLWVRREGLTTILHPQAYLYTSVKNACLNLIRAEKRKTQLFTELPADTTYFSPVAPDNGQDKELVKMLENAVAALPAQRRMVFKLIKEDGLNSTLVAELMDISKRTVENQLYKALKTIAATISDYLGYNPQQRGAKKEVLNKLSVLFLV